MKMKMTNKRFTLIELIIVIVVIGILAGMALPKFMGVQRDAKAANLKNDCDVLQTASSLLETTRDQDVAPYGADVEITLDTTAGGETVLGVVDLEDYLVKTGTKTVATLSQEQYKKHLSKLPKTGDLDDYRVVIDGNLAGSIIYVGQSKAEVEAPETKGNCKGVKDGEGNEWFGATEELSSTALTEALAVPQP